MTTSLTDKSAPDISEFLRSRIEAHEFPSAVYLVGEHRRIVFADALGIAVIGPPQYQTTFETIYDLASLTKPLVTGLLCAHLFESDQLKLESLIADYVSEFQRDKAGITIRHLLTHTSGLPAWRPLYLLADRKEDALVAIAEEPLEYGPGEKVVYSDLGFITLGFVVQRLTNTDLVKLAQQKIFTPLQLENTFFNPAQAKQTGIAACENGNGYERDMCEHATANYEIKNHPGWRTQTIWGEVHDGNAYFLGGAAGHAGLFSSAADTFRLANQFLGGQSELLASKTCELFHENMTRQLNEARSFAWQLAATKDSTAGASLPLDAFGHTGFTGTSCWVDAVRERVFILLTNRTHNRSLPFANINATRREFHRLAVDALDHQRAKKSG